MSGDGDRGSGGPQSLDWGVLLAKWVEVAKAGLAGRGSGDAGWEAFGDAVPHMITLQAHVMALGEAGVLGATERGVARDRAGVAMREAAAGLSAAYRGVEMPGGLLDLLTDSRRALEGFAALAQHVVVDADGAAAPDVWALAGALAGAGYAGDVLGVAGGVRVFRGEPVVVLRPEVGVGVLRDAGIGAGFGVEAGVRAPVQVYRVVEGEGAHDVLAPMDGALPAGRPLLGLVMEGGVLRERGDVERERAVVGGLNACVPADGVLEVRAWEG